MTNRPHDMQDFSYVPEFILRRIKIDIVFIFIISISGITAWARCGWCRIRNHPISVLDACRCFALKFKFKNVFFLAHMKLILQFLIERITRPECFKRYDASLSMVSTALFFSFKRSSYLKHEKESNKQNPIQLTSLLFWIKVLSVNKEGSVCIPSLCMINNCSLTKHLF